ncbi:MAG: hypothetical protein FWG48_04955 [Oscillospiraceae bacterium]|nr:hypothetical protein [Oscillospiraceae bacterium]
MKTREKFSRKHSKPIAAITAAFLLITVIALTLTSTMAAPEDIKMTLSCESGIAEQFTVEVGQTKGRAVGNLNEAISGDTSIATVSTVAAGLNNLNVTGVKAGVVTISYGNRLGVVLSNRYQVTDSRNISAYTIKEGGEVRLSGPGKTKASPVNVTTGQDNIKWRSLNTEVATVDANTGAITAEGKGMAIIIGEFTDKWGVDRDVHVLVGVGVILSGSKLQELIDLINKGDVILNTQPSPYTDETLGDLQDAVDNGKDVLTMDDPTDEDIYKAIEDLIDALGNLEEKVPEGIIEGGNGNYYKPVGVPPHIYEVVNKDGSSKQPPEYVYNTGDPGDGNDRPAYPGGNGGFLVEDPEGSNIWKYVDESDGSLIDSPAVWGGSNGKPGGGDDKIVELFGDEYWHHVDQNVWQKVDKQNPTGPLGPLTGGGPQHDPETTPVTEIYDNTANDGKYYVGPLGPDDDGNEFYYGDPMTGESNGMLDSTAQSLEEDDVKYYKDKDGNMTTTKPPKPITETPESTDDGRILTTGQTGDSAPWLEIARNGDYSLIIRTDYLVVDPRDPANLGFQNTIFSTSGNNYQNSRLRDAINQWFDYDTTSSGENLPQDARLRKYTVANDAYYTLGTSNATASMGDGYSKPSGKKANNGNDIAFALSFGEAASFVSKQYATVSGGTTYNPSPAVAIANFGRLKAYNITNFMWLRSPGSAADRAASMQHGTGSVFQNSCGTEAGLVYPALWVHNSIFE